MANGFYVLQNTEVSFTFSYLLHFLLRLFFFHIKCTCVIPSDNRIFLARKRFFNSFVMKWNLFFQSKIICAEHSLRLNASSCSFFPNSMLINSKVENMYTDKNHGVRKRKEKKRKFKLANEFQMIFRFVSWI